jgi:hypothetical protein
MSCVAVVHEVVAHGCSETYADGLSFAVPKPVPRIVSTAPWETGALSGEKVVAARKKVGLGVGVGVAQVGLSVQALLLLKLGKAFRNVPPQAVYSPLLMAHESPV